MKLILIFVILIHSQFAFSQVYEFNVEIFNTTKDFLDIKSSSAIAIIRKQSEQHIQISSIINPKTRQKVNRQNSVWVIKHKEDYYFNLFYSQDLNQQKTFVKLDILGKYCAAIIDKNSPNIVKTSQTYYGGGLTGALIKESSTWGNNWEDKNEEKRKILFINCFNILPMTMAHNKASDGNFLTFNQLKILYPKLKNAKEKPSFEEVLEIINELNKQ